MTNNILKSLGNNWLPQVFWEQVSEKNFFKKCECTRCFELRKQIFHSVLRDLNFPPSKIAAPLKARIPLGHKEHPPP